MFRRGLTVVGWGAAGVALAAALFAGAFAVAGTRLTEPATPISVSAPPLVAETSSREADRPIETRSAEPTETRSPEARSTGSAPTAAPTSFDDRGGNSGSDGGSSGAGGGEPGDD